LLHLLRSNVDTPPDWVMHLNVLIDNVSDLTARSWEHGCRRAGVGLDIDTLEWMVHLAVHECHVVDASVVIRCWNRSDRETNTVMEYHIAHHDVLRAVCDHVLCFIGRDWLHCNSVVKVGNIDALDENV